MKKQILEKVRILPNVTLPSAENSQRMQRKEKRAKTLQEPGANP